MNNRRILVVDDNLDNCTLITDTLLALNLALNYEEIEAVDGEEGIRKADTEHPDLILMDLSLPQIDGWTVTSHINDKPELTHIPIIALTAHAMIGEREKAFRAGYDDFISKPIDMRELQSKITRYLR